MSLVPPDSVREEFAAWTWSAAWEWPGASEYPPVPEIVRQGSSGEIDWLLTAVARGLADFHRRAPVTSCPFDVRVHTALEHARRRVHDGIAKPADMHPEHAALALPEALAELERLAPASEDLVVCHGDYCMPNVLLDETGAVSGYVDLGELGVADRWWDLVVGAWTITWNIGPGWEELFYAAYGIEPDPDRIHFFRLRYDLVS